MAHFGRLLTFNTKGNERSSHTNDPWLEEATVKQVTILDKAERMKFIKEIQLHVADKMYANALGVTYQRRVWHSYVKNYRGKATTDNERTLEIVWFDRG